ncbi:hypothetical protein V1283_007745 [Bradyrhizobium sp. AZCC 2262]
MFTRRLVLTDLAATSLAPSSALGRTGVKRIKSDDIAA